MNLVLVLVIQETEWFGKTKGNRTVEPKLTRFRRRFGKGKKKKKKGFLLNTENTTRKHSNSLLRPEGKGPS